MRLLKQLTVDSYSLPSLLVLFPRYTLCRYLLLLLDESLEFVLTKPVDNIATTLRNIILIAHHSNNYACNNSRALCSARASRNSILKQ